jgi:hypothetical protein
MKQQIQQNIHRAYSVRAEMMKGKGARTSPLDRMDESACIPRDENVLRSLSRIELPPIGAIVVHVRFCATVLMKCASG